MSTTPVNQMCNRPAARCHQANLCGSLSLAANKGGLYISNETHEVKPSHHQLLATSEQQQHNSHNKLWINKDINSENHQRKVSSVRTGAVKLQINKDINSENHQIKVSCVPTGAVKLQINKDINTENHQRKVSSVRTGVKLRAQSAHVSKPQEGLAGGLGRSLSLLSSLRTGLYGLSLAAEHSVRMVIRETERMRHDSSSRRYRRLSPHQKTRLRRTQSADPALGRRAASSKSASGTRRGAESAPGRPAKLRSKRSLARLRFRRAQRLVLIVVHCMHKIIRVSDSVTVRTAVELQWYTLNTSTEARKLAFNPSLFAKSRAYARLPKWAKQILRKDVSLRTDADCWRLHALLRGLRSFDKFTERIQIAMCRSFTYLPVGDTRIILRKGHVGQNFYFVYSGSVFVNVEDVNAQGERFLKTEVVLSKGDSFGELALLKDIERTATVACRETCELLVVDKHVFSQVCPKIFDLELEEKIRFVSQLPLFHEKYWTRETCHNLVFESQIQEYKTNKVVVIDSTKEEWMYTCMEGQCRIIKCLAVSEEQQLSDDPRDSLLKEEEMLTAEFLDSMAPKQKRQHTSSRHKSGHDHKRSSRSSRRGSLTPDRHHANRKKLMLRSLALEYEDEQKPFSKTAMKDFEQEKDLLSKNAEEKRVEEHRERARQGVVTLSMLMKNSSKDLVYLDIGTLQPGDVFDLAEILRPDETESKSCLILVSSGAKLLRIKKVTFRACMTPEAMDHAKHIAMKRTYPSNKVLIKSYKEKARWDKYKQRIVGESIASYCHQARRRDTTDALAQTHERKRDRKRDRRLLSMLRSQEERANSVDSLGGALALDDVELVDHEDTQSRLMRETDVRVHDRLLIPAINPGFGHRKRPSYSAPGGMSPDNTLARTDTLTGTQPIREESEDCPECG